MNGATVPPNVRVLFLCTQNSARSQIAEALLHQRGGGRFTSASAGANPADRINPGAVEVLSEHGIDWGSGVPKSIDDVSGDSWDLVVTVCDRARDACPVLPGAPLAVHWGTPDPASVEGTEERREAFRRAFDFLDDKICQLVQLSDEQLQPSMLPEAVREINPGAAS